MKSLLFILLTLAILYACTKHTDMARESGKNPLRAETR